MTVSKDVNLGTLIPILAILLPMCLTAIWWAGTTTARFESVVYRLNEKDTETLNRINIDSSSRIEERQRMQDRLASVEQSVASINSEASARAVSMANLETQLTDLRGDLRQNNDLLRNLLVEIGSMRQGREQLFNERTNAERDR